MHYVLEYADLIAETVLQKPLDTGTVRNVGLSLKNNHSMYKFNNYPELFMSI